MADEQKLRGKKARMRCRACDTLWVVEGPPLEPETDSELAVTNETPADPSRDAGHDAGHDGGYQRRAAVVRRGAERERRDLFATRPPDVGSIRQTLRPPPSSALPPPPPSVGARNEDSVLFRVDQLRATGALKSTAPPPPAGSSISSPPRAPSFAPGPPVAPSLAPPFAAPAGVPSFAVAGDDEGMIDLMALSSRAPKPAGAPVAPLFSDAPGAFARDASSNDAAQNRAKNRNILIGGIAGAVGVVALAVVGVVWAFRDDPRPRILTAALPPVHVSVPVQTAPPPPTDPAAAVAANSDDESTHAKGKKAKGKGKAWVAAGMKRGGPTKETSTAAPPAPKRAPKAADPCGCKGDFNCILSCSAKGHK